MLKNHCFVSLSHKVLIYVLRVPQCLPPRTIIGTPLPSASEGRGGGPNSDDWRKSLVLCLLCGLSYSDILSNEHTFKVIRFFIQYVLCVRCFNSTDVYAWYIFCTPKQKTVDFFEVMCLLLTAYSLLTRSSTPITLSVYAKCHPTDSSGINIVKLNFSEFPLFTLQNRNKIF